MALDSDFTARVEPHRRELLAHCYRMLGSIQDAEDLVQETLLRAWRARDRYDEAAASLRTWLYTIATNACLTALQGRARRPLPSGLGGPGDDPWTPLVPAFDIPWLQPFPVDPDARLQQRGTLRLALIAAMQQLPPRQRAVLILRDVLAFSAAETAQVLQTSPASVNSALQRARAGLGGTVETEVSEPADATVRQVVDRYLQAFEAADVGGLVALLTEDVVMEMPPVPLWLRGRADYGRFMTRVFAMRGTDWRMRPLLANQQPAAAAYCRDGNEYRLHTLQVYTVTEAGLAATVAFQDPAVFAAFGLESVVPK
ncbi:MAG TPA: sigma-70 family RNA polymerase sigma factor [Mycobacteriales bacterium]|nr:sigma-70 family RNA polymerase sigma factor [Mycobacteriales bacterium]